jgi:hypothetical protein
VNRAPRGIIADAIAKKAAELPRYTQAAGGDIRLLPAANRINNSGKLALDEGAEFDFQGFSSVDLYPYPEDDRSGQRQRRGLDIDRRRADGLRPQSRRVETDGSGAS